MSVIQSLWARKVTSVCTMCCIYSECKQDSLYMCLRPIKSKWLHSSCWPLQALGLCSAPEQWKLLGGPLESQSMSLPNGTVLAIFSAQGIEWDAWEYFQVYWIYQWNHGQCLLLKPHWLETFYSNKLLIINSFWKLTYSFVVGICF